MEPIVADVMQPATLADLPVADWILYAVGFDRSAGWSQQQVYVDGLRNVLQALTQIPEKFIYISSTGVYGQDDGSWVDETSPCEPRRASGQACLAAEQFLQSSQMGARSIILRMAGLYGRGRIPRVDALRRGEPIATLPETYLNLIHVDDAAAAVSAVIEHANPPDLYVVADDEAVLRRDYYEFVARQLGAPAPRFVPPTPEAGRGSGDTSKRVNAARIRHALRFAPAYPTYRQGLVECMVAL